MVSCCALQMICLSVKGNALAERNPDLQKMKVTPVLQDTLAIPCLDQISKDDREEEHSNSAASSTTSDPTQSPPAPEQEAHIPTSAATPDDWVLFGIFDYLTVRDPMPEWVNQAQAPISPQPAAPSVPHADVSRNVAPDFVVHLPPGTSAGQIAEAADGSVRLYPSHLVYTPAGPSGPATVGFPGETQYALVYIPTWAGPHVDGFAGENSFPSAPISPSTIIPSPAPASPVQQRNKPRVPSALYKNYMANLMWMELNKRNDPRPVVTDHRPEPITSCDLIPSYPTLNPTPTPRQRRVEKVRQAPRRIRAWVQRQRQPRASPSAMHAQMAMLASEEEQAMAKGLLFRDCQHPCNCLRCFRASGGNVAPAA